MSLTTLFLGGYVVLIVLYLIYDTFIIDMLKGKTSLTIQLRKRNIMDTLIFAALFLVIFIITLFKGGTMTDAYLLLALTVLYLILSFVRQPKIRFKKEGFFYGNFFVRYDAIDQMNLAEDGILAIIANTRRHLIYVRNMDDLERMLPYFTRQ
ncbi:YobD family protein [Brochothrix thermosphacta]|uniref:UPF0266 membrane protein CNY62_04450 n=1 Tax=Brochothrix thermosphacta TaxID=2756 RepID=A0A1D2L3U2_BROTH|nr:DUF986 family protein [Brochothrix thermosphacta]ATF25701.1 DUF986 domain-containing protein [Brochothrix thermosphacta]ATH85037.1 DUF986 domain-containing protein [Brochothrix thermosphacta]MPQ29632.1 DUF986 family protein [Brochothrix thermosphacta]ODJ64643.1 hypothetical protein BFR36_10160 [Brochothrix thermosphacta]ODJ73495.1 hypothetical protein BFR39_11560 [Brochothrix thermosphacta]